MAIKAMPSGENIAATDARPTDRIAVPSALNAAPAVCSAPAMLKLRTIARTARAAFPAPLAIMRALLTTAAAAAFMTDIHPALKLTNADIADDTPPRIPVLIACPTSAHVMARS